MTEAYVYDALRTPRGRGRQDGALHEVKPVALAEGVLRALDERHDGQLCGIVDDVLLGIVTATGEQGGNLPRAAALLAGIPPTAGGAQVNRFCASGLETVNLAAAKIRSGWERLVVAGGVESMSRVSMASDGGPWPNDPDTALRTRYVPQGVAADLIATLDGRSRAELDEYAARSQQRAAEAWAGHRFAPSIVAVRDQNDLTLLDRDELIRPATTPAVLAKLPPAFAEIGTGGYDEVALGVYHHLDRVDHLHTAGNSCAPADGAALVLVGNRRVGEQLGLRPRARVVAGAVSGADPTAMLTGPAPAARRALSVAGLQPSDIDLYEVNEAFAAVVLRFADDLKVDLDRINVNGGSIAMGHPLGATGAMLVGTLVDELERREARYGLVTLCVGAGMGVATIVERVTG